MDKKDKDRQISIRLPEELIRLIDVCAKNQGEKRTEYIRETLIARVEEDLKSQKG